jgi:hypothetical protein
MDYLRVFLKICEGCGVLWLRSGDLDGVYCRKCSAVLSDFPAPHAGKCRNRRAAVLPGATKRRSRCRSTEGSVRATASVNLPARSARCTGGEW